MMRKIKICLSKIFYQLIDWLVLFKNNQTKDKTLLIIKLDAIGDYVLFRNFIAEFRNSQYRDYQITLCGNMIYQNLTDYLDQSYIDHFIWIDRKLFALSPVYRYKKLKQIRAKGFHTMIQPVFSREYYLGEALVRVGGAREKIAPRGDLANLSVQLRKKADHCYTRLITVSEQIRFEFLKNRSFFEKLFIQKLEINKPALRIEQELYLPQLKNRPYAVIFPGASRHTKIWPDQYFSQISRYLAHKYQLDIIICGSPGEKEIAERIVLPENRADDSIHYINLTGQTTLIELAKILENAVLLVSNDTSAVHIGVAVNTNVVVILNGEHFGRFSPYPSQIYSHFKAVYPPQIMNHIDQFDFFCHKYRYSTDLDINKIDPGMVMRAVDELMTDHKRKN